MIDFEYAKFWIKANKNRAIGFALGIVGYGVIVYAGGWLLATGILIAGWSNNIERSTRR